MKAPMTLRQYLGKCPGEEFATHTVISLTYAGRLILWVLGLPFAPVALALNRRIMGKRLARKWKAKYGYRCPEMWCWWMKYM